jgi:hypothetical protein
MKLRVKCKDATLLVSRAQDDRLSLLERTVLTLHLAMCANCARFAKQLGVMRRLLRDAPPAETNAAEGLSDTARERIAQALHEKS